MSQSQASDSIRVTLTRLQQLPLNQTIDLCNLTPILGLVEQAQERQRWIRAEIAKLIRLEANIVCQPVPVIAELSGNTDKHLVSTDPFQRLLAHLVASFDTVDRSIMFMNKWTSLMGTTVPRRGQRVSLHCSAITTTTNSTTTSKTALTAATARTYRKTVTRRRMRKAIENAVKHFAVLLLQVLKQLMELVLVRRQTLNAHPVLEHDPLRQASQLAQTDDEDSMDD